MLIDTNDDPLLEALWAFYSGNVSQLHKLVRKRCLKGPREEPSAYDHVLVLPL